MDYQTICAFLYKEARYLDQLTEDPQSEVSLIYYPNRNGLEDRVFRIKTERSSASMPEPRTNHMLSNIEVLSATTDEAEVRYNFHTLSHRYRITDHYFGTIYVTLGQTEDGVRIVLKNDYIRQVVDVYHI